MAATEKEGARTKQLSSIRVGAAAVNITPPKGTPMAGYYSARYCEGVIDDLYAKALVLDDGQSLVAIVSCDLISIPAYVVAEARRQAAQKIPISTNATLISATHTHTGPTLWRESALDELVGANSKISRKYSEDLPGKISAALVEAFEKRQHSRLWIGRHEEHELSFNRRYWMRDGSVGWNPGKLNPNILRPVGPIDPEVLVLYAESEKGEPLAAYVNFALHCDTVGGSLISADYPGVLSKRLCEYKGQQFITLFGNGACGDINHINVNWADRQKGPQEANRIGTILAGDVMKALAKLEPITAQQFQIKSEVVQLPLAPVTDEDIKHAKEIFAQKEKAKFLDLVFACKVLDVAARKGKPVEAEVQVIALGKQVAWVGLPGEIFVTLGLNIKSGSPFPYTFVVELANGSLGYFPHRSAYSEGQYEVVSARFAEGAGELLVTNALKLLLEAHNSAK
ncbi:MAG: neutral/alkaline non-lysosomal ceramidase N-terminal domain-containing protein [Armatimonadetes bacterium]|nr:neutral/alkaline non-lysosomal ceramidase N-terminal domain-containing protein [Armatimonadota bacterium]